ncbi:MAG: hypothetical protein ACI9XO_004807 [Paraglaciecola sp.]|jgi:hypothetical protein
MVNLFAPVGVANNIGGQRFWGRGFGVWSTGNITDEMVQNYLEHHRKPNDPTNDNFMLEKHWTTLGTRNK